MISSTKFPCHTQFLVTGLCMLLVLLGATTVQATTYYVSLTGNDANSGTSTSTPFKTFARAVKPLRPGDTLYIRGGTWTQQLDLMSSNISGTASSYIKIAGYPGEQAIIRYTDPIVAGYGPIKARGSRGYLIFENMVLDGAYTTNKTGWAISDGNHHFVLRNLEIKNFKFNGLLIVANDIQVIGCIIHDQISVSTGSISLREPTAYCKAIKSTGTLVVASTRILAPFPTSWYVVMLSTPTINCRLHLLEVLSCKEVHPQ